MNSCVTCGRSIRLGALRVSILRKRGCAHWLELTEGGTCVCLKEWRWTKWLADKSRPTVTEKKIAEWNAANPGETS